MANNRMWLVTSSGDRVLLAKYYPSTGWRARDDLTEKIDKLLLDDCMDRMTTTWGNTDYRLEFEDTSEALTDGEFAQLPKKQNAWFERFDWIWKRKG